MLLLLAAGGASVAVSAWYLVSRRRREPKPSDNPMTIHHVALFKLPTLPAEAETKLQDVVARFNAEIGGVKASFRATGTPGPDGSVMALPQAVRIYVNTRIPTGRRHLQPRPRCTRCAHSLRPSSGLTRPMGIRTS